MINNAELGLTIQKLICDRFNLVPNENATKQFNSSYNHIYFESASSVIDSIFNEIKLIPKECLTFTNSSKASETLSPHNFLLSNNATLSIRTNKRGDKIAPRVVGQAGIETLNEHFGDIFGCQIKEKSEIKSAIIDNIHLMLPIFIDYLFVSDYTVWIQNTDNNTFSYVVFDNTKSVDMYFDRSLFTFTRDLSSWNESTTLKYKGKSIAEIQIHKNRTFKFRFIMNAISDLLIEQKSTTETFGITAEKAICDLFKIEIPGSYKGRYLLALERDIMPTIKKAFDKLPNAIKSTGAESGARGENSKCSYDFLLEGGATLSVKTNTGKMVCPPEVGQPSASTCLLYFKDYIDSDEMTNDIFKTMVLNHISEIIPIYIKHLFDSDFLLWIYRHNLTFDYKIFGSDFADRFKWEKDYFSFTKPTLEDWNESNTVKYNGITIGEFQVHRNRSCYKFRFNLENLSGLIAP